MKIVKTPPSVWLFDPSAMNLGDIVLERGTNASSALIAKATGGRFSHALIWVGSDFVEAMPDGVRSLSFARVPVCVPANWLLLRAKTEHVQAAQNAAVEARHMVFKGYDPGGAFRTVFRPRKEALPQSRFCSQLVAEAYERAGLSLLPGRRPEMVTPNMLAKIKTHTEHDLPLIDSQQFQPGPYPRDMLDRSSSFRESPMRQEGDIARRLFKSVQGQVDALPLPQGYEGGRPGSFGEVLDFLPYFPPAISSPIADVLLEAMINENYFRLLVPQMADLWFRVNGTLHWQAQVSGWEETRQRHLGNALACGQRNTIMPHPIWIRLQVMYSENATAFAGLIAKATGEPD